MFSFLESEEYNAVISTFSEMEKIPLKTKNSTDVLYFAVIVYENRNKVNL
jgi:hypothetical protein